MRTRQDEWAKPSLWPPCRVTQPGSVLDKIGPARDVAVVISEAKGSNGSLCGVFLRALWTHAWPDVADGVAQRVTPNDRTCLVGVLE